MRVLFLTTHLEVGGIAAYTVSVAKALARRGHQPVVVSSGGTLVRALTSARIPHQGVPALRIKSELHPRMVAAILRVWRIARRDRPDVIHAQTRVAQVVAWFVGWLTGIPVVTTAHGFYDRRWGRRRFPCWGRRVIAVSSTVRERLLRDFRVPASRIASVMNGVEHPASAPDRRSVEVAQFRQRWGVAEGPPVIGAMLRLVPSKGARVLIEAFHYVRQRVSSARLLIVGGGPEKSALIRLAYALGEQEAVIFTGPVENTAVPLSVMDVVVLPSRAQEAFGLAAVEAMAMRRPVVASAIGGLREIVVEGETGRLVPPENPQALAAALERLMTDGAQARQMGEAGYRRFMARFTIERVAEETERVYHDVLQETGRCAA